MKTTNSTSTQAVQVWKEVSKDLLARMDQAEGGGVAPVSAVDVVLAVVLVGNSKTSGQASTGRLLWRRRHNPHREQAGGEKRPAAAVI